MRALDPAGPGNRLFGNLQQFSNDVAQARRGEPPLDSRLQGPYRLDDLVRIELAVIWNQVRHGSAVPDLSAVLIGCQQLIELTGIRELDFVKPSTGVRLA